MLLRTLLMLVALIVVMGLLVFVPAGTLVYWQAWLGLACYFLASLVVSFWLVRNDRALLERRLRGGPWAEGERSQKVIMTIASLAFVALLVIPGLDRRLGWSTMPAAIAILGDALMLLGWLGILAVFRANSFAAATIQVAANQTVISTGPYAVVRHPMYATATLMMLGLALAFGSWWGLLPFAIFLPALAWRLLDEERVLRRDLAGYAAYCRTVRWRLLPSIW
jgi:protein-S-isoprenylcysteine O-methyltransferase Ste14